MYYNCGSNSSSWVNYTFSFWCCVCNSWIIFSYNDVDWYSTRTTYDWAFSCDIWFCLDRSWPICSQKIKKLMILRKKVFVKSRRFWLWFPLWSCLSLMYKIVKRTMILILLKPVVKYEFLSIKLRFFSLKYAFLSLKSMYKLNISVQNTNLQTNQGK